ncbi:MAG: ribonuclease J [Candidatus Ureaplasma intestinipullorum]|uniref:Ribonuclease J n=1 Tax=Candidatus Ureaplasma intestinipullorum TaxID=2838770 RepID=A0A9E2KWQ6_9BACT|nr:ribonuclease J [Candidatus Ureaplasma intestinipullorum]
MENNKNKHNKTPTYIYALGGLEEIGKNTYVVEHGNDLVLVDAGIKFANDLLLGFDGLIANYSVLVEKQDKIKALIITHGHEDHIGGIVHILKKVKIPKIIAPVLSTKLIEKKLNEHKNIFKPEIIPYLDDDEFKFGEIEVDFFRVCHSIPDSFAVAFKTPNGNIVETGDFRFDFATSSDQTNLFKLMQIASRGIDLLLCESTSSEVPGFSESEKYIIKNIEDYIKEAKGRVFVSTFASNLSRIESIIAMGINLNRKVAILGKSMEANVKISRRLGYLKASDLDFIQAKDIVNYPDNEVLVILTGSQGEENAALNVMASQKHSKISLKPTDTIILSSNPIPGNFAAVEQMTNNLYKLGVTVIENSPEKKIHASGHATRSEQQLMIQSIGAKYVMPIHGEYKMLKTLKKNTMDLGYAPENIIIAKNGDVVQLLDHEVTLTDIHYNATPMFINGHDINENSYDLLQERNTLSSDGIVRILIVYSQKQKSIINVTLLTRGSFYAKDFSSLVHKITSTLKHEISKELNNENFDFKNLEEIVIGIAKPMIWRWIKKNPIFVIDFQNFDNLEKLSNNKDYFIKKQNTAPIINNLEENIDDGEYYGE